MINKYVCIDSLLYQYDLLSEGDTLVLNFGSNVNIIFEVIMALKKMCSIGVSIFLCLSQLTPLPSRVTFVNLDMSGKELRKMTLHLFSLKEGQDDAGSKMNASASIEKELGNIESQLMNVIMTPKPLPLRHKAIVELSAKMDSHRAMRKASAVDFSAEMEKSVMAVKPEVLLPTAILAACCDMSTVGNRPFMSLSQFVNFTWSRIQEGVEEEELHQIIFQRYCLAFSDREQLLFQTLIGQVCHQLLLTMNWLPKLSNNHPFLAHFWHILGPLYDKIKACKL